MISEWKPKTKYFIELSKDRLKDILDENLVQIMGYPEKEGGYTFADACFQLKKLKDETKIAVGIQLRNANELPNACVKDYITEDGFNMAKQVYGVTEFLTIDEYKALEGIDYES